MSAAAGFPEWTQLLRVWATEAGCLEDINNKIDEGDYEGAALTLFFCPCTQVRRTKDELVAQRVNTGAPYTMRSADARRITRVSRHRPNKGQTESLPTIRVCQMPTP
jgi:hypothetical protein